MTLMESNLVLQKWEEQMLTCQSAIIKVCAKIEIIIMMINILAGFYGKSSLLKECWANFKVIKKAPKMFIKKRIQVNHIKSINLNSKKY